MCTSICILFQFYVYKFWLFISNVSNFLSNKTGERLLNGKYRRNIEFKIL